MAEQDKQKMVEETLKEQGISPEALTSQDKQMLAEELSE